MIRFVRHLTSRFAAACTGFVAIASAAAAENVTLVDVPDYSWYAGCYGTASGNLMGYWDRHGLPDMYTGPTAGGLAPLTSVGSNSSIRALWASQQGVDGRPAGKAGHIEDYWESQDGIGSFESTADDPYVVFGRAEHTPDCIGDFLGQSQRKYANLNGECSGNIDGFAFNFWDKTGNRRTNFVPPIVNGVQVRDIQSGLREWSRSRGYSANVSSQLADVNPEAPLGTGFTFDDIKAEINAGYPVLLLLQRHNEFSRELLGTPGLNPLGHAILIYGYVVTSTDVHALWIRTSWGDGGALAIWNSDATIPGLDLPIRGAITYHPEPKITRMERTGNQVRFEWHGPLSILHDEMSGVSNPVHQYVIERATTLDPANFTVSSEATSALETTIAAPVEGSAFFRVRLVNP
jgi:hypothetical protein